MGEGGYKKTEKGRKGKGENKKEKKENGRE